MSDTDTPHFFEDWTIGELIDRLVFPGYWPPALPNQVIRWFRAGGYDPDTMPRLQLAQSPDGNISLLGWGSSDNDDGPNFIEAVRGYALTDLESRVSRTWPNVTWCPRCWNDAFVPYDAEDKQAGYDAGFYPPALSRTTREEGVARIYVCSQCGQDEAFQEMAGRLTPPERWPLGAKGFGWGGPIFTGGLVRGPYGTNEGDKWLAPDSDVQRRLDADGEGLVLIHEIIDGEEKLYTTALPDLIEEATEGHRLWLEEQGRNN